MTRKYTKHLIYHSIYLCCHFQRATEFDPKISLYINTVKGFPIQTPEVQHLTLARIESHLPFFSSIAGADLYTAVNFNSLPHCPQLH